MGEYTDIVMFGVLVAQLIANIAIYQYKVGDNTRRIQKLETVLERIVDRLARLETKIDMLMKGKS